MITPQLYEGHNKFMVGNGKKIDIISTRSNIFQSQFELLKTLNLQNILHAPSIIKNLLSVSKFAQDNNVFFEFHKDQVKGTILLMSHMVSMFSN